MYSRSCSFQLSYSNLAKITRKNMPQTKLRVLFVEASSDDLQQTLVKLSDSNFLVEYQCVNDAEAMQTAMLGNTWDVVLCSYNPPAFGGLEALNLMHSLNIELPFLFLSHNLREENIIQAIQAGAGDYIYQGNLNRLVPAIEHYLREAVVRQEHRQMLLDLKENQIRLHALISNLPGMAYQLLQTSDNALSFPYVSEGSYTLLGLQPIELESDPTLFINMLHPDDRASYTQAMQNSAHKLSFVYWEGRIQSPPDGEIKWVNLRCSPRTMPQGLQWEGLIFNITERKLAEIEAMRSQEQLRELSAHIQDVREQERLALSREVHDDMGSMLTAIKMDLAWMGKRINSNEPVLTAKLTDIENLVTKCAAAASNIARNLRPSALDSFGIVAAIEVEANEFEKRTGIPCVLDTVDEGVAVPPNISITLFRIFQEALNNIMKHAQASKVKVLIHNRTNSVNLTVSDNGRGLNESDRLKPRSFGLRGVQERVARFAGEVRITSKPGKGTTIAVSIPQAAIETGIEQAPQQSLF
jgi:two-component system, NarL family, sensor histidine kinase UhpB